MKFLNASGIMTFASLIIAFQEKLRRALIVLSNCCKTGTNVFRGEIWYNNIALQSMPRARINMESQAWIQVATQYDGLGAGLRDGAEAIRIGD